MPKFDDAKLPITGRGLDLLDGEHHDVVDGHKVGFEQCSVIITTNKSPQQWVEALDDEVLVTALLDRLLFHCQVIKLQGSSYRMENRREIFKNAEEVCGLATAATPPSLQPHTSSKIYKTDGN